ncbi:MAG: ATP-binding protein [Chloroflexi bacterium]|nr:ATP-binding protein [Chloroflexota bacterium]MDA8188419.1 ATP-binding protein [Dehalococcoidales bacterium]
MMFLSLRSKLIVAFVAIIFLCLFSASGAFVFLLRGYQTQLRINQLTDIALPMSFQARLLERAGASPAQIVTFLQEQTKEMNVRILLLDSRGSVVEDSQDELRGYRLEMPASPAAQSGRHYSVVYTDRDNLFLVVSSPRPVSPSSERFINRAPAYSLVLAVPQESVASAWLGLAPILSISALISLVASVAVAILLSRSISKPISEITRASEEMALGNYDQSIAVKGRDETGRMAGAFNAMAEQVRTSHRTLRDFLANVSHELKTPLTSIQGFSQAMVDGTITSGEGFAAAGGIINEEAERMRRLVDDLLYLSKIESGQIPLEKLPVDLQALLDSCARKVEHRAKQASITIETDLASLPQITGDPHKLEQVFLNLLDNAVKHTPAGGTITVSGTAIERAAASRQSGNGRTSFARVGVHNTGSVIPSADLDKVFERFFQVDKSRARTMEGSGLGLAIVQEIALAHGGNVEVHSDANVGTEFVVYLPVAALI